jgi:DNA (cytosine-5)-methyltransferase 1
MKVFWRWHVERAKNIEAVDLFCGVGGLTRGVSNTGINVIAGLDIDNTCQFAYEENNNAKFILADVGKYDSKEIVKLYSENSTKILMGCAPCQPFSKLQKGTIEKNHDSKWGLLYAFLTHIKQVQPDIISMENVPELEKEQVFLDFYNQIKEMGYHIDYKIVDASDYGVPQRRRRLLFLASKLDEIKLIGPTNLNNKITVRQALDGLSTIEAGKFDEADPLHRASNLSELNLKRIKHSTPGGTWRDWPKKLLPECYKKESGQTFTSVYGRMKWDDISPTLTTQFHRYGTGRYGHPVENRALSLREGAILQSFPKDYKFVKDSNYVLDDIARQIGNAVPVRLGEVIGESIRQFVMSMGVKYGK